MKIRYLGPASSVNVPPYGAHAKGQEKDYPEAFALDLIATSKRQQFAGVLEAEAGIQSIPGETGERPDDADPGEQLPPAALPPAKSKRKK